MSYIGREPQIGNFQVCDAISVVNGQAAYTMQVGGANVSPETANHMIVSLNGIIQAPGTSYTVAGSTITFASNLATGDVINFIHILGSVLDLGTPSDGTVTNAKLASDLISGETDIGGAIADADLILVDDGAGGTLRKCAMSRVKTYAGGDNTPAFFAYLNANQSITQDSWSKVNLNAELFDTDSGYDTSAYKYVVPETGKYLMGIGGQMGFLDDTESLRMIINKNGSLDYDLYERKYSPTTNEHVSARSCNIMSLSANDELELYCYHNEGSAQNLKGANLGANGEAAYMFGFKLLGV